MPEGPDGKTIIIVKKVDGHGGHHGGAWKVAYADFVTAMMALFMVLWLVNSAAEPTRQRIASYFRKPGVFQKGSGTPLELGGGGILSDAFAPPASENSQILASKRIYEVDAKSGKVREYFDPAEGEGKLEANEGVGEAEAAAMLKQEQLELEELAEQIREALSDGGTEESGLLGDVDVQVDQRGLLIEIMDTENASMFQVGSASILPAAQSQLDKIAQVLSKLPNPIDIEGHTDSRPFRGKIAARYDNWNLSSDRANSARRVLQDAGVKAEQIARIVGYADQRPKLLDDTLNPANRRITISMRFTQQAQEALKGTRAKETSPKKIRLEKEKPASETLGDLEQKNAAKAEAKQLGIETTKEGSLRVEVGTTLPEGAVVAKPDEAPTRPSEIKKDKIFGRENPFFD